MTTNNRVAAALFLGMLTLCVKSFAQAQPRMSKDEAIKTFQRFSLRVAGDSRAEAFSSVLHADSQPVEVNYYDADHLPSDSLERYMMIAQDHPHGYWRIIKKHRFESEVDDWTGRILGYLDLTASDENKYQPAGEAIPEAEALKLAQAAIQATGSSLDQLKLSGAAEYQNTEPPTAAGHEWYVSWLHTFHGVPSRRDGARVYLAAETGKIISVSINDRLVDPSTAVENVMQEQAVTISAAQLSAVGITDVPFLSVEKQLVPLNRYWEAGNSTRISRQTRAVWNCEWGYPGKMLKVWVDTETGDVIGGEYEGSLGRGHSLPKPKFGHQLKHSEVPLKAKAVK